MKNDIRLLNHDALKAAVERKQLKQWWLAEQIGVSRYTVLRWLNGKIRHIQTENLERLAALLECTPKELEVDDRLFSSSLADRRHRCAVEIIDHDLAEILRKADCFELYETIVKSLDLESVSSHHQFDAYCTLSSSLINQAKFDEATRVGLKASDLAQVTGNNEHQIKALGLLVVCHSALGDFAQAQNEMAAIEGFRDLVAPELFVRERARGLQTYAMMKAYDRAIELFDAMADDFARYVSDQSAHAIAFYTVGNCYFQLSRFCEAERCYEKGYAAAASFPAMLLECQIGLARVRHELSGLCDWADVKKIEERFGRSARSRLSSVLLRAANYRHEGRIAKSKAELRRGMSLFKTSPVILKQLSAEIEAMSV